MIFWLCLAYVLCGLALGMYWSLVDGITAALCDALEVYA